MRHSQRTHATQPGRVSRPHLRAAARGQVPQLDLAVAAASGKGAAARVRAHAEHPRLVACRCERRREGSLLVRRAGSACVPGSSAAVQQPTPPNASLDQRPRPTTGSLSPASAQQWHPPEKASTSSACSASYMCACMSSHAVITCLESAGIVVGEREASNIAAVRGRCSRPRQQQQSHNQAPSRSARSRAAPGVKVRSRTGL